MLMYSNCSKVFRATIFLHVHRLIRMYILHTIGELEKITKRLNDFAAWLQQKKKVLLAL